MAPLIVIGASAGGVNVLVKLAHELPADLPAAVLVVLHVGRHRSLLPELMAAGSRLPAAHARDGEAIEPGRIRVAPPDFHMLVDGSRLRLIRGAKEHHTRPAIDPLFRSAALAHGPRTIGVVLSGKLDDGTAGLQAIKQCGGIAVVQNPADALEPSMPESALRYVHVDHRVDAAGLPGLLSTLAARPQETAMPDIPDALEHEVALLLNEGDVLEHMRHIGTPSTFVCPDCHGALWQVSGARPPRYRCHTGHGFSQRSLEHTLTSARDEAIWNALRAVQENAILLKSMAEQRMPADAADATRLEAASRLLHEQVSVLQALLQSAPAAVYD